MIVCPAPVLLSTLSGVILEESPPHQQNWKKKIMLQKFKRLCDSNILFSMKTNIEHYCQYLNTALVLVPYDWPRTKTTEVPADNEESSLIKVTKYVYI